MSSLAGFSKVTFPPAREGIFVNKNKMDNGWIKLHRKLYDNPWMSKPSYLAVWIRMLCEASHTPKSIIWEGERINLKPGQFTCGANQLSLWTGVPRGTVERILKTFKNEEQIEELTSFRFRLITIKNWGSYQKSEELNEEQVRSKRGANEEQVDTPKEYNNLRMKEENTLSVTGVTGEDENFKKFWESYPLKKGKGAAERSWKKIKEPKRTLDLVLVALEWQKRSAKWKEDNGRYIPHPSTYLNQRRWEDEPDLEDQKKKEIDDLKMRLYGHL